jgi:hypothetical protein
MEENHSKPIEPSIYVKVGELHFSPGPFWKIIPEDPDSMAIASQLEKMLNWAYKHEDMDTLFM